MATQPNSFLTPEQYLEIERKADFKSEYYDGKMFAMAGANFRHNVLVANLIGELRQALRPRGCRILPSDMRVRVSVTGLYTYPDVIAVCGEPELGGDEFDVLLNPGLIVEVLSPSTEAYDRGRKFEQYRALESLRAYLMVSADRVHVELYTRRPDREWKLSEASDLSETIDICTLECKVPLSGIYEGIEISKPDLR